MASSSEVTTVDDGDDDDLQQQQDELEAVSSIYPEMINFAPNSGGDNSVDLDVISSDGGGDDNSSPTIRLRVSMPRDYPSRSPPTYDISAPFLKREEKKELRGRLEEIYLENTGQCILFLWVEEVRQFLDSWLESNKSSSSVDEAAEAVAAVDLSSEEASPSEVSCPPILTGDCIEDRRSVFQGHYARVASTLEVRAVMEKLMENRKIANATHNMYAYRIFQEAKGTFLQDCDDDGETHAGSRMLHLLEIVDARNALVVVSRWYGGTHLGPDRFKHINNAARNVLEAAGAIKASASTGGSKKTNKR